MVSRTLSQKGSANTIIIVILVVALLGVLGFVFWQKFASLDQKSDKSTPIQNENTAISRDATRKKYAGQFASTLFSIYLLQGQTPSSSQKGLDSITTLDDKLTIDPLTNRPYTYVNDQSTLKVGEATFKVNATCDNKISGSGGAGLIIDGSSKSVAVALKLESGGYACESNL